jgi:Ca2+-binding RTX toxin-like protein
VNGGEGDDEIQASTKGAGSVTVDGGGGNDEIEFKSGGGGGNAIVGGTGTDTCRGKDVSIDCEILD